ncbi:MAG: 50S ribosomal protein L15 [Oscillospiraceae bacterium]|nr:50S ribosomal protein L15 [Oscillospiraceae bacterium]
MKLHELSPSQRAVKPKRKGRGPGTGNGKTAGRGHKGQNSRAGGGVRPGFEGGQMPLIRRVPKRGFNNIFAKKYAIVNVEDLNRFNDGDTVDPAAMQSSGLVKKIYDGVKILAKGELSVKLSVKTNKISDAAKEKIISAGGSVEVL